MSMSQDTLFGDGPLIDPDCRGGKHGSCVGGPCECWCHRHAGYDVNPEEGAAALLRKRGWTVHPPGESCLPTITDEPRKRHHKPDRGGSKVGAYEVSMRATSQKADLLRAIVRIGRGNADAVAQEAGLLDVTYWMRLHELREQGLIAPVVGEDAAVVMEPGRSGDPQMVCQPTPAGKALVASWESA